MTCPGRLHLVIEPRTFLNLGFRSGIVELHPHLHLVKALAVNAVDVCLGYECLGIYSFYDSEYLNGFDFSCHYQQNFDLLLGIPAHARKYGAATLGLIVDRCGNLLPATREYGELHRLAVGVDHEVCHVGAHKQHDETIYHIVNLMEKQI